jgi:hypothetical protein
MFLDLSHFALLKEIGQRMKRTWGQELSDNMTFLCSYLVTRRVQRRFCSRYDQAAFLTVSAATSPHLGDVQMALYLTARAGFLSCV